MRIIGVGVVEARCMQRSARSATLRRGTAHAQKKLCWRSEETLYYCACGELQAESAHGHGARKARQAMSLGPDSFDGLAAWMQETDYSRALGAPADFNTAQMTEMRESTNLQQNSDGTKYWYNTEPPPRDERRN